MYELPRDRLPVYSNSCRACVIDLCQCGRLTWSWKRRKSDKFKRNFDSTVITYHLLSKSEVSKRGLNVLTERNWGQYVKAEVWDFPVMTERMMLISYLLCRKRLKRFSVSACARKRPFDVMLTGPKINLYRYASIFHSVTEKIVKFIRYFLLSPSRL